MNEFYDFEDEDEDEKQLPEAVQSYQPSILPKVNQNDVRTRLMNYYKNALNPRRPDAPLSPTDIYTRSALQTGGLQGMAQGLAQAGTVFGKTPTADSFVQSSDKTTKALAENAAQIAQSSKIDPRIAEYLLKQPKKLPLKSTSFTTPGGKPVYFDPDTGQFKAGEINVYRKPEKEGGEPKESKSSKEFDYRKSSISNNVNKLKALVRQHGTVDLGQAGSAMDSLLYQIAVDYAKMVDPTSVAREGEVAAAQKYLLPIRNLGGFRYSNEEAEKIIDNFLQDVNARSEAFSGQPGFRYNPSEEPLSEKEKQELKVRTKSGRGGASGSY